MAHSQAKMQELKKINLETQRELERISKLEDPIQMFEDKKQEQKTKYSELKQKLSQMTSLNGSLTFVKSPNGTTELLESLFDKNHSQFADREKHEQKIYEGQDLF